MKTHIVVDVESNGPLPGRNSMIALGAVAISEGKILDQNTFLGYLAPLTNVYDREALAVSGFTHEETLGFPDPAVTVAQFDGWVRSFKGTKVFWSDNLAYDWQWANFYLLSYTAKNPFGYSGRRIGDVIAGQENDLAVRWKHRRVTKHTHNPVDDAMGNAEVLVDVISGMKGAW